MIRAVLPHPALSATIAVVWVLLANDVSPAHVLLGLLAGVVVPKFTSAYWPDRPRIRGPLLMLEYAAIVLYDIVLSNIQVARLVLFRRGDSLRSRFITVPLDLRAPEAITLLAGTITMTPGTVTADVSADGRSLLVHCLDVASEQAAVAAIKERYERRLRRIFP
jgi:multicomponent K+:H+ antiporter subunit E